MNLAKCRAHDRMKMSHQAHNMPFGNRCYIQLPLPVAVPSVAVLSVSALLASDSSKCHALSDTLLA